MTGPVVLHIAAVEFTASRLLRPQLAHLAGLGYDVRLACAPQHDEFAYDLLEFKPERLAFPRSLDILAMTRAAADFRRLVRRLDPAIVHFHSPAAALPGRAALALGHRPRIAYTVHGFLQMWDSPSARDRILDRAERALSRLTDLTLFQSGEDFNRAQQGGYKGRLVHLGNGVADDWFDGPRRDSRDAPLHAVFVGRLTREKGVAELLTAAKALPEIRLTIVGDALPSDRDSLAPEVAKVAAESGGRVRAVGMVSPSDVRSHLRDADVFVLPSWREGVPRSVIEAMAVGLPVITTTIRGCRELIESGTSGWLIPPNDADALVNALRDAASAPRTSLVAMGDAARTKAWEQHRERSVFDRISAAYRDLGVSP